MKKKIIIISVAVLSLLAMTTNAFAQTSYTAGEVSAHNTQNDCWMSISGKVYSLSGFLTSHPGGTSVMIQYCGKDATSAFATKGGRGGHSSYASSLLPNYYVGNLAAVGTISTPASTSRTEAPTTTTKAVSQIIPILNQLVGESSEGDEESDLSIQKHSERESEEVFDDSDEHSGLQDLHREHRGSQPEHGESDD